MVAGDTTPKIVRRLTPAPQPPAEHTQTWADRLGFNKPTASPLRGFVRGAGAAAADMAQGSASSLMRMAGQLASTEDAQAETIAQAAGRPYTSPPQPEIAAPESVTGTIGTFLPDAAMMKVPTQAAVQGFPRLSRAARHFETVMGAARNVPIDLAQPGAVALRISQLADRGGSMPKAVRDFIRVATDPQRPAMTYEVGRDFASNISRLSANEMGRLTPVMAREVASMRVALNNALAQAARQAGHLDEYRAAMREYAQAKRVENIIKAAVEGAKKAAPYAAATGAAAGVGGWLGAKFSRLLGGS